MSVEGALLEWVNVDSVRHTPYLGHWSDDSKQDASAMTHNMRSELCILGNVGRLAKGLAVGGTVWKGMDSTAVSYQFGTLIYGQGILLAKLGITINVQVERTGHGSWLLDRKTGSNKCYCQECMCSIVTPKQTNGCYPPSGLITTEFWLQ